MREINDAQTLRLLFDELEVGVLIVGHDDGKIKYLNRRVCKDLGRTFENIKGQHYRKVFWPEFVSIYDRLQAACEDGKEHTAIYYWAEMALWEQVSARNIRVESTLYILLSFTYISEVVRSEYKFESIAYFDNLLKLPNGAKLEEDINELASVETVALIYFDIERFEDINNLYGWDNGDNLLKQVRDWLLASEHRRAQLYRVSNGFAILGRQTTLEEAKDRSLEILRRFTQTWTLSAGGNNLSLYCTIKLGIVHGQYVKNEMRNLLVRTIRKATRTKEGYALYDERVDLEAKRAIAFRDTLINCIFNDMKGFEVHYQPIVNVDTECWTALEALCRWTMPDGAKVSPEYFIGLAEQLGLIDKLDTWVRATAMRQCVAIGLDQKDCILDVNFSPTQNIDGSFINSLLNTLEETGFPAEKLKLEIIESAKMNFDERNVLGLNRLKESGIILCLDDFGTGYSSFANLIRIPAATLKTEKLFLEGLENDQHRQYFLRMLTDIAHYLNMHLVAEGVETSQQLQLLREFEVDYAQGFLFSKPLSYEELQKEAWRFQ